MADVVIPKKNTAQDYLGYLGREITRIGDYWFKFGEHSVIAYQRAWDDQGTVLTNVKKNLERTAMVQEAMMTFALNIVTVGVGGAIAGTMVKKVYSALEKPGEAVAKELVDKAIEATKKKIEEPIKKITETSYKLLQSQPVEDAFNPPGLKPVAYGATLKAGILDRKIFLENMVHAIDVAGANISIDAALKLTTDVLNSPFMRDYPENVDEDLLYRKAYIAFWLGWIWVRDLPYWRMHSRYYQEAQDFQPILDELTNIFPSSVIARITQRLMPGYGGMGYQIDDNADSIFGSQRVIDMERLIEWAYSMDAVNFLLNNKVRKNDELYRNAMMRILMRRMVPYAA
jgi:hypothetical protein